MPDVLLATLNARYIHAAFGLRYLMANLDPDLAARAAIREFDLQQRPIEIVEALLLESPRVIGFGVYIWNVSATTEVVQLLRKVAPEVKIVLGGPEVSYELEGQLIVELADVVITGEADLKFNEICRLLISGTMPEGKVVAGGVVDVTRLRLPYDLYGDDDLKHRIVYVEASRGCPFTCEFCLSSLDIPVRAFPLEPFLSQMQKLLDRGLLNFKFVDRTFNLNLQVSAAILRFFLERLRPGLFVHFEMIPDRLPEQLRDLIRQFPEGCMQFEVGIQTFDAATSERIRRRQDVVKLEDNLKFLRERTGVHVHADLIAGLPGETLESFGNGFDRLVALGPQEIQVGILKRLRGTSLSRHDSDWGMVYSCSAPYEILGTASIPFAGMQRVRRFARFWDLVANSGNFNCTLPLLWRGEASPFQSFLAFSEWAHAKLGRRSGIALATLSEVLFDYLTSARGLSKAEVGTALADDYRRQGRKDPPECVKPWIDWKQERLHPDPGVAHQVPKRQKRHAAA